MTLAHL
ncbi:hypothetical protein VCHENC02_5599A, partial [Vibrio harveyi]